MRGLCPPSPQSQSQMQAMPAPFLLFFSFYFFISLLFLIPHPGHRGNPGSPEPKSGLSHSSQLFLLLQANPGLSCASHRTRAVCSSQPRLRGPGIPASLPPLHTLPGAKAQNHLPSWQNPRLAQGWQKLSWVMPPGRQQALGCCDTRVLRFPCTSCPGLDKGSAPVHSMGHGPPKLC